MSNTANENSKEVEKIIEQTKNSDQKIYPILKPGNWVGLKAGALSNTLIPAENGAEVVIAYGMDTPDNFVFLTQKHLETMDGQKITSEAFENLGNYEAELEFVGSLDNKAVATNGNDFSSEIILSKAHMLKAHAMLDAEELLVSIPRRTCMTIISRDVDEETMNKFAYLHNFTWEDDSFGNAPITNSLFIVKEGTIVGHIPL
ncbi:MULTISPECIES: DUF1444 family protein [Polaribacter]|uniref:DUF1444 family protein n=1 Tax=Polaribacter sejongensis TaxID=985043 RepID=A0AAJ1QWZ1_9FLAO|nr:MULTISPECIES: DUF1444 family protein [Polaribacter]MDN3619620.1 DUF1444 family protein [Polaribacter undariae]UWD32266.1 DUF1444 family protein [Polaribacter undariae]